MGKRKKSARKPQGPKRRDPLPTSFKCVFCSAENAVTVKIDKRLMIGTLSCKQCTQSYQSETNALSQPVDVYSDWIDACDDVAKEQAAGTAQEAPSAPARPAATSAQSRAGLAPGEKYTAEDAGFIDDDDVDAEADYADE